MSRILIVEDEPRIASFLEKGLKAHGFVTTHTETGESGIAAALEGEFDLVILDLGLPDRDGMTVLEALRGQGFARPIILLTARDDLYDKVTGLEAGADDYVTKPFRFEELLARIRARLRSVQAVPDPAKTTLNVGAVVLDLISRQVQVGGQGVELSAREFILTETFMRHAGQVLSREQLLDLAWGYGYDPGSNIVDVYVGYLRKKLGSHCIETVRGMGYRMVLPEAIDIATAS
ncbi:response regulator transcription factor [Leptolyngbya sp. KIOST-1]|uniref:response regulator transcription factor n=1 Tax=Leptolyngbya sp. KIOST-1 TaxID=1229172 RepID=UPI00055FEA9F|nr:response regulator transcription factor [Leptolyngbya sp. KIOST-1]